MPKPPLLVHNGTFLVMRKLQQEVVRFRQYLKEEAERLNSQLERETDLAKAAEIRYGRLPELERSVESASAHLAELHLV